jgi:hypothetical protein
LRRAFFSAAALGAACLALWAGGAHAGPVTLVESNRTVGVRVQIPGANPPRDESDGNATNDFGSFEDFRFVAAASEDPVADAEAFASQSSQITENSVTFNSRERGIAGGDDSTSFAGTILTLTFMLDQAHRFTYTETTSVEGLAGAEVVDTRTLNGEGRSIKLEPGLPESQRLLAPGTYFLTYEVQVTVDAGDEGGTIQKASTFTLAPAANPIPLPPAAWSGLATLAGGGIAAAARRRARR